MALNDCYTTVWKVRVGNDEGSFRTHWKEGPGVQFPHPAAALNATLQSLHADKLRAILSNQCELIALESYQWKGDIRPPAESSAFNQVGNVNSQTMPAGIAYVFDLIQFTTGQRVRGRCYVPGVPESFTSGNDITPQASVLLAVFANAMANPITVAAPLGGGTFIPVIRHRTSPPGAPPVYSPINVELFQHSRRLGRQRRRLNLNQALS